MTSRSARGEDPLGSLHIFALSGIAIAQPLFDLLGRFPNFFVARSSSATDVFLLACFLVALIPLGFVTVEVLLRSLSPLAGRWFHRLLVVGLSTFILLPVLGKLAWPPALVAELALATGIAFCAIYVRRPIVPSFLSLLAVAPLVFVVNFLANTPVRAIVFPDQRPAPGVETQIKGEVPVVMVVFDEFPVTVLLNERHRVDDVLFPNFAKLAETSYWFRNATTVASSTMLALPAIVTGQLPTRAALANHLEYPENLFTLLGAGYAVEAVEVRTNLCPETIQRARKQRPGLALRLSSLLKDLRVVYLHIVTPPAWAEELPPISHSWKDFGQDAGSPVVEEKKGRQRHWYVDRLGEFDQFVRSISSDKQPTFHFIHLLFPHVPYQYLPSGRRYQGGWDIPGLRATSRWGPDGWLVKEAYRRFVFQVGAADKAIGRLLDRLRSSGLYGRSLIIVTADHGASFVPNLSRRDPPPGEGMERDIAPVPLFIKLPGQREGVVDDSNVQTIDIVPTIADVLGIEIPWRVDGHSAIDPSAKEAGVKVMFRKYMNLERVETGPQNGAKYETVAWKAREFPVGQPWREWYRVGRHADLVGRLASGLREGSVSRIRAELDKVHLYDRVDPKGGFVPSHVRGRILADPSLGNEVYLAVSVNGVVRAVTRAGIGRGDREFTAMVPESAFQAGQNHIGVWLIEQEGSALAGLVEARTNQSAANLEYMLEHGDGHQRVRAVGGEMIPVKPGRLKGQLEFMKRADGAVELFGIAYDAFEMALASRVLVFEDDRAIHVGKTSISRQAAAKYNAPGITLSGFQFLLPETLFRNLGQSTVRMFAVSEDGEASELDYYPGYPWAEATSAPGSAER